MANPTDWQDDPADWVDAEPGHPGHDPYKDAHAPQPEHLGSPTTGTLGDAAKSWANVMTLGAAPELEGAAGALADSAIKPITEGRPQTNEELLAAYKALRDEGKKQHDDADNTTLGKVGQVIGLLTPHPLLPTPAAGASIPRRIGLGAAVGAGVGGISGAANSPGTITDDKPGDAKRMLLDTGAGMLGGGVTGGALAGGMAAAEGPVRTLAEGQALKAAGLEGGIKNASKAMGLNTEAEALARGRDFLDEGLVPWKAALPFVSAKKAVAGEAAKLKGVAGNAIGAELTHADASGVPFDYDAFANAALEPYNSATSVAQRAGGKTLDLADDLAARGQQTPGSFTGANQAKSDAWQSARFSDDAPMAAKLYRRAVGSATGNIEDQVRNAVGDRAANSLADANRRYGIAADAAKLANESGTRTLNRNTLGLGEKLALASGFGGSTAALTGHTEGALAGVGGALLANYAKKHGNALAARLADTLAGGLASSSGGHLGGIGGQSLANRLIPWSSLLQKHDEEQP